MSEKEDRFLEHISYPYKLEKRGQEIIRHYPEGAEAIATAEEWALVTLLIRLDAALGTEVLLDGDAPIDQVIPLVEKEVAAVETKRGRKAK